MPKKYNLFANTGMQFIYTGLLSPEQGLSWHNLDGDKLWIQCRTTRDVGEVVFCVDTNTGSSFHVSGSEQGVPPAPVCIPLETLGIDESIEVAIISEDRATGQPKDVALVLDLGNSRSVGLLVEGARGGGVTHMLPARPFELTSHHLLWRNPTSKEQHSQQVFESGFVFVSDPVPPVDVKVLKKIPPRYEEEDPGKGLMAKVFKKKSGPVLLEAGREYYEAIRTDLFRDISPVRMGTEVDFHLTQSCYEREGRPEAGLSSPKRYLWAHDQLAGSYWHQFIPGQDAMGKVAGEYFKHLDKNDRDWESVPINESMALPAPAYPRRSMVTACVLELLNRAYQQINSEEYRLNTPDPNRKRLLKHLVMSYPSGLTREELGRYRIQVEKAVRIFCHTHKLDGKERTQLRMAIDEGTAGQLAFIYGETLAFESADSWLKVVGRPRQDGKHSVRIATIDIGGGTSDMVISDFMDRAGGAVTGLVCEIRHVDGANRAGDDLLEAVLQKIIIPQLANQVRLSRDATRQLFEGVSDQTLVNKKSGFLREIWKPLANRYIAMANGKDGGSFKLNEIGLVKSQRALDDFEDVIKSMSGGSIIVGGLGEKEICFNRDEFRSVVMELFRPVLTNFCDTICRFDCDIVTLAGRPSNLHDIQEFVRAMLPLPDKRIVPMGSYRTGSWYPLPDPKRPGVIGDPKSVVVVGCAIEHLCKVYGSLGSLQVTVDDDKKQLYSYYWGEVSKTKTTFRNSEALFKPGESAEAGDEKVVEIIGREIFIARRLSSWDGSQPVPTYAVRYAKGYEPHGRLLATLSCQRGAGAEAGSDESLVLAGVEGSVVAEDGSVVEAVVGEHVEIVPRGMIEAQHFLDAGVLLGIDYNKISDN
ncbi:hypothetical protein PDESU_00490 [Pontiella desulfatans]|uniref:Virulence factor SrfB n=1 Tax=Pontiella desulfatans TaxID=2750659 RepID=A0A6C2TWN0_PONDE|nr:virulence factor SrfB [Pontiella desulfatans]VGO11942.1 hypothetical protein PDESU_00490 [Pontiella desulfatans]